MKGGVRLDITYQKNWHRERVVCHSTSHNNTSQKNWHWWRVVCDLTSLNNTSQKNWHWWRVVCDLTSHNNTSQKNTWLWHRVVTKGSGDEGKWWLWEVVTKGSGGEGNAAKCIVMAAWMLHGLCFGEKAGARNLVFFCVKWLRRAMKGTSCVRRGCGRFIRELVPPLCSATSGCSWCVVLCVSWICGCRSHWNGCMIVVIWCCHVCREMQVCYVMLAM